MLRYAIFQSFFLTVFSPCQTYRYQLYRKIPQGTGNKHVLWVMLNPSIADHLNPDPTIRRCMSFSAAFGASHMCVANLYALVSTDPKKLLSHPDPVGPENDEYISNLALMADVVVVAWGAHPKASKRAQEVLNILRANVRPGVEICCLGTTKSGAPKHPLYLASSTTLRPFPQTQEVT